MAVWSLGWAHSVLWLGWVRRQGSEQEQEEKVAMPSLVHGAVTHPAQTLPGLEGQS